MLALALFSGGLDSILAVRVTQSAGAAVTALHFVIPFHQNHLKTLERTRQSAASLGVELIVRDFGEDFLRVIEAPQHGYGKRLNPCLDCRIYQLKQAAEVMKEIGASFLVTGEVLDQRPNSQRRDAMDIVVRDAGLRGYVVRPLCARHMMPTIPEENGWIDRTKLFDFKGRGRNPQIELAKRFGITDYPGPGGGCLLTCEEYSRKVSDLLEHDQRLSLHSVALLKIGRHLRLSPMVKLIVGKDQTENEALVKLAAPDELLLHAPEHAGPTSLYCGPPEPEMLELAAAITAGYSNVPQDAPVQVNIESGGEVQSVISVIPLARSAIKPYFIYSC